jgi:hypothetical protein
MLSPNVEAMLTQLAPVFKAFMDRIAPLLDQPVVRVPYNLPLAQSVTVPAGATGFIIDPTSFSYSLEWPLEVHTVKFSQDPAHTFRDWRIAIQDQVVNQPLQKAQSTMVATMIDDNTGAWRWEFPWTVRPKGGALVVNVDNLDTVNPITIDLNFIGYLEIPR